MTNIVDKDVKFNGRIFKVEQRKIVHEGETIYRDVVTKNDVVVCLVHNVDNDTVVLTSEYRAGTNQIEVGFVAGIVDDGEYSTVAAIREVQEETGYEVDNIYHLGTTNSSAGFTNEKVHHFIAYVHGKPGNQDLDEDEKINVIEVPSYDLEDMIVDGRIKGNHAHATLLRAILYGVKLNRECDDQSE
jgi:ADP-ribose pyrophosphatase